MAKLIFQLQGAKELKDALQKRPVLLAGKVRQITKKHAAGLQSRTMRNMTEAYTIHPTGTTKRSVDIKFSQAGLTATVAPHTEYFPYLEFGTRFMTARPTLKPAFAFQSIQYVNDLKKLMK